MNQTCLAPGVYRVSELVEMLNVSRSSIERYIERFSLPVVEIMHKNKLVRGISLDEDMIQKLMAHVQENKPGSVQEQIPMDRPQAIDEPPLNRPHGQTMDSQAITLSLKEYQTLQDKLMESEKERARLSGEMARVQEVITSQRETIDTLKASLMLESRRQDTTRPIEMIPASSRDTEPEKPGLLDRIKRVFGG